MGALGDNGTDSLVTACEQCEGKLTHSLVTLCERHEGKLTVYAFHLSPHAVITGPHPTHLCCPAVNRQAILIALHKTTSNPKSSGSPYHCSVCVIFMSFLRLVHFY